MIFIIFFLFSLIKGSEIFSLIFSKINNYKIIVDKIIILCYNKYIIKEVTKALDKKKIKEKML